MPNAPFLAPERDSSWAMGRGKDAGVYASLPGVTPSAAAQTSTGMNGPIWYTRFYCAAPIVVVSTQLEVTTLEAATNMRMAIYSADTSWQPTKLWLDSGDVSSATTGVKTYTPGTPILLPRGRYLTGFQSSGSVAGVRCIPTTVAHAGILITAAMGASLSGTPRVTFTYGAFTDPGTAWTGVTTSSSGGLAFVFINQPTTL